MRACWSILLFLTTVSAAGPARTSEDVREDEQTLKAAKVDSSDEGLLGFFRRRTIAEADQAQLKLWIRQLGDDSFDVRERASAALVARGAPAEPFLKPAAKSPDVEVSRRAEECLRQIKRNVGAAVPLAAARALARRKPAGAAPVLLAYLPFADNDNVADEVRHALFAVAVREGKPDDTLVAALKDKDPLRRAAAAEALCHSGLPKLLKMTKELLRDPQPIVRMRVALALASAKDKDAIPVLIDVLAQLPEHQAWPAEDYLAGLAGDQAPAAPLGQDGPARERWRKAWAGWWERHGSSVDLARSDAATHGLGYTLLLLLQTGEALEVDSKGRERWHIRGLQKPLDVQYLPGKRLLVAEYDANRVTERNLKGEILWEKRVESPLVAQRLPNGNTFIATNNQLLEVSDTGVEVYSHPFPAGGDAIMRAQKLRNGDLACVLTGVPPTFRRLDSSYQEVQRPIQVKVSTSGGRIDVLNNGRVLVPEKEEDRVVEYDASGKEVWKAEVKQPIAAVRLPGGNTLVTSMAENRALEIDRSGKVVWEYRSEVTVNRAFRR
jgi:hypothetical protein